MHRSHPVGRLISLSLAGLLALAASAQSPKPPLPDIDLIELMPAAREAATRLDLPIQSKTLAGPGAEAPKLGNTAAFVVDAIDGNERREWIVQLKLHDTKPEEKQIKGQGYRLYVNTGREVFYPAQAPEGIAIRILGPYVAGKGDKGAKDLWSGTLVNGEFLRIGLAGSPRLFRRLAAASEKEKKETGKDSLYNLFSSTNPIPAAELDKGRALAAHFRITEEDERAFAAFLPAVISFFRIAAQTNGVRDILFDIVDIPWWKIVANGGQIKDLNMEIISTNETWSSEAWGLPAGPSVEGFGLLVYLYNKPALMLHVIATDPRTPLQVSAGVLALGAARPDGKGPRLVLRMLGSRP